MAVRSSDDRLCSFRLKQSSEVIKKQNDQRRDRMLAKQEASQVELVNTEVIVIKDKWVSRELRRSELEQLRKETLGTQDVAWKRTKWKGEMTKSRAGGLVSAGV